MAAQNPFEKEYVDERKRTDLASILDQFNLPPAFISFVRANQQAIKITTILIAVIIITWAIYDSYSKSRIEKSSSALYNALQGDEDAKIFALEKIISDYKGTSAAVWAEIELAHNAMKNNKFSEAIEKYREIQEEIGKKNPLYPLVTSGMARSLEEMGDYSNSLKQYEILRDIKGFESLGVFGIGRIHEIEGKTNEAITVYDDYLSSLNGEQQNNQEINILQERIARLKAKK